LLPRSLGAPERAGKIGTGAKVPEKFFDKRIPVPFSIRTLPDMTTAKHHICSSQAAAAMRQMVWRTGRRAAGNVEVLFF
jgi:hypothetical protein